MPVFTESQLGQPDGQPEGPTDTAEPTRPRWYALYTRSYSEQLVCDQLRAKGFQLFLPKIDVWSRRSGVRRLIPAPLFPGYLFLQHVIDKVSFLEVGKARGLVRVLGGPWDRLEAVPDAEIEAIRHVLRARMPVMHHQYLREGQRVRITRGPLAGVEGIFLQGRLTKGLVVLSVELLRRSVAVEVDCTSVVAA